jgi:sulfate permease, SulP family
LKEFSGYLKEFAPRLIEVLKEGYGKKEFFADSVAGLTVAIVALPLAMAIAIASNVPPAAGIFTAIVAGFIISAFGGSRYQIGGPTAAFAVTIATVVSKHGYEGLMLATFMAGVMLLVFGFFRAGALIKFIPYPVLTGFTSAIALLIFFTQLKDFFGLTIAHTPVEFAPRLESYAQHLHTMNFYALGVGIVSIAIILFFQKRYPRIPGPLAAVVIGALGVYIFGLPIETIESRFGELPQFLPSPVLPTFSIPKMLLVLPDAITIAVLAAIESLLSAVIADSMTGDRHKSNTELIAQGSANIASVMFGGIAATGAIARTATNIKSKAFSPVSGIMHAVWLGLFMMLLAPLIVKVPLAVLSGILMVIAWNMSEIRHIRSIMRSPRSDRVVLFTTFALTVLVDLNFAVQVGISLASILFIAKITNVTEIREAVVEGYDKDAIDKKPIPQDTEVYEIMGPLFFGMTDKLKDTLTIIEKLPKVLILRMRNVPMVDAAGIHALEEFAISLKSRGTTLILSGVKPEIKRFFDKTGLTKEIGEENIVSHIDEAIIITYRILGEEPPMCVLPDKDKQGV